MIQRIIYKIGRISPDFVGKLIVKIPVKYRYGRVYKNFKKQIIQSEKWKEKELENYIISHFNAIFQHAKKYDLYRKKYEKSGIMDMVVKNLDDINKIPILTKSEIRKGISQFNGHSMQNTGGTSGDPMPLFLDKDVWSREWAHYHSIWSKVGYKFDDAKIFFRGVNIKNEFIKFDFEHNIYIVNLYKDPVPHIDEFFKTLISNKAKYFQGYPSAIYDFLKKIENELTANQKEILKRQIKYCFFSSEYPTPQIIKYLKNTWEIDFISCYGHSEVCVLGATLENKLEYFAYHTYGYIEDEGNKLLGTSYHNFDMPLIRYDTGDLVRSDKHPNGVVKSFEIKEGRVGDFIVDKNNNPISLTGMFFGRHHKIFNYIDHIQIFQANKGQATILVTQSKEKIIDIGSLMDLENIDLDFNFISLKEPIRTKIGKVVLKVNELPKDIV